MENNVNGRIAEVIKAHHLSNNAFAKSINKSSSAINFMVDGRSKPSFDVLEAILEKYPEVSTSWLITGEGEMWKANEAVKVDENAYLNSYLEKLEEQFRRLLNQLETKDSQIQSLQEMLKMTLGKLDPASDLSKVHPLYSELSLAV